MRIVLTHGGGSLLSLYDTNTEKMYHLCAHAEAYDFRGDSTRRSLRPFGITWDSDYIYVANRNKLITLDKQLKQVPTRKWNLDQNTHQIAKHEGNLLATCARKDAVKVFGTDRYFISPSRGVIKHAASMTHEEEQHHINSVTVFNGYAYYMMNNRAKAKSVVSKFNLETREEEARIAMDAIQAHNIMISDNIVRTLDTGASLCVVGNDGSKIQTRATESCWLRGLAGTPEEMIVAWHDRGERHQRDNEGSSIEIIKGDSRRLMYLPNIGAICDLRLIDGEDHCHHNPHPFPANFERYCSWSA